MILTATLPTSFSLDHRGRAVFNATVRLTAHLDELFRTNGLDAFISRSTELVQAAAGMRASCSLLYNDQFSASIQESSPPILPESRCSRG